MARTKHVNVTPKTVTNKTLSEIMTGQNQGIVVDAGEQLLSADKIINSFTEKGLQDTAQKMSYYHGLLSKYAASDFEKSRYAALPFKALGYAAQGAAEFGWDVIYAAKNAGDDISAASSSIRFGSEIASLDKNDPDKLAAAEAIDVLQKSGMDKYSFSMYNPNLLVDKKGQYISERAKNLVKLYQDSIKDQNKLERNRAEKDFFQNEFANNYWSVKPFGRADKTLQNISKLAGSTLASGAVFGAAGSSGVLGLREYVTAANIAKKGIALSSTKAKEAGVTLAGRALYNLGTSNYVLSHFSKMQALSSIAGNAGVFGLSFNLKYREARDLALSKGYSFDEANNIGILAGTFEGLVESKFQARFMSKFIREGSPTFWNILTLEAIPEGAQEVTQELISKTIYYNTGIELDAFADIASDLLASFVGGAFGGAIFGLAGRHDINSQARIEGLKNFETEQRKKGTFTQTVPTDDSSATPVTQEQQDSISMSEEAKQFFFTEAQEHVLTEMKSVYEERAKKHNPNITDKQLENGWKIIRKEMEHEINTGEFTQTLDSYVDMIISSTDSTDPKVKQNLEEMLSVSGDLKDLDLNTNNLYSRLLSKDGKVKFDAEWELAQNYIIEEFKANGSEAQGKLVAEIFKNRMYELSVLYDGSPLEMYEKIKPTIINLSRARMNGQELSASYSIFDDMSARIDSINATLEDVVTAKEKAINVHSKLARFKYIKDKTEKADLLKEISTDLFGQSDFLESDSQISEMLSALQYRAEREFRVMSDMGLIDGNNVFLANEDLEVIALLREQGYDFADIVEAYGIKVANKGNRNLSEEYANSVKKIFPPLTREEIKALNSLPKAARKEIKYKDDTGFASPESMSDEQAETLTQEQILEAVEPENEFALSREQKKAVSALAAADRGEINEQGEPITSFVRPNALYFRNGKIIVVRDGVDQGELAHEAGHFIITEILLKSDEISAELGVAAIGSLQEIYNIIDENVKISGKRLSVRQKQETLLDLLALYARTGDSGNTRLNEIFGQLQSELSNKLVHPSDSLLQEAASEDIGPLGKALKAFVGPTAPIRLLESLKSFEQNISDLEAEPLKDQMISLLVNNPAPFTAKYIAGLNELYKDGSENVHPYHALMLAQNMLTDFKTYVGEMILARESEAIKKSIAPKRGENVDLYFFEKTANATEGMQHFNFFGEDLRTETTKPFRVQDSAKDHIERIPKKLKKLWSDAKKNATPYFKSVADIALSVHEEISADLLRKQWERDGSYRKYIKPATDILNIFDAHNAKLKNTDKNFISEADATKMKDVLRNGDVATAMDHILPKLSKEDAAKVKSAFEACRLFLEEVRIEMDRLGAIPAGGWIKSGNYWPSLCIKYNEFCEFLDLHPEHPLSKLVSKQKKQAAALGNDTPGKIEASLLDAINGVAYGKNEESRVTSFHSRADEMIPTDALGFFANPFEAYMRYMQDTTTTIMNRRLFGSVNKNSDFSGGSFGKILLKHNLLGKVGKLSEMSADQIKSLDEKDRNLYLLTEAVRDYMQRTSTPEAWRKLNEVINITTIANFQSAVAQGFELAIDAAFYGLGNTTKAVAMAKKGQGLKLEDIYIDNINETFREVSNSIFTNISKNALTLSLFNGSDRFFKTASINAIHLWIGETAKTGKPGEYQYERLMRRINEAMAGRTEEEKATLIDDIKNDRLSDDVKFLVATLFSKQQPTNALSIQSKYNSMSPLGKLCVFKLNTVTLTQMDAVFTEIYERFSKGDLREGLKGLFSYILYAIAIGVPVDLIKDLAGFRVPDVKSSVIFSPMQIMGINSYSSIVLGREGLGSVVAQRFAPPLNFLNDLSKPIINIAKGKDILDSDYERWARVAFAGTGYGTIMYGLLRAVNDRPGTVSFDAVEDLESITDQFYDAIETIGV